jgi:hypothetical protein
MSTVKEPTYFTDYGARHWTGPGSKEFVESCVFEPSAYSKLFEERPAARFYGESSTSYLDEPTTPSRIAAACGDDVKFIALVRNPVARAYSEYMFTVRDGWETESFVVSLEKEPERIAAGWAPHFRHVRRGLYAKWLTVYRDQFGADRLLCINYTDFVQQSDKVWFRILDFLGAERMDYPGDYQLNRSGVPRSRSLHELMTQDNWFKSVAKAVIPAEAREKLRRALEQRNLRRIEMTREEQSIARAHFIEADEAMRATFGYSVLAMSQ